MVAAFLCFVLFSTEPDGRLPDRLQFEQLNVEQGLSQSTVQSMIQDQAGYLWLGTFIGLNRYDGYRFEAYRHDPNEPQSLPGNIINALLEDDRGRLWIGTGSGLCRYDGRDTDQPRFVHFPVNPQVENALFRDNVTRLLQDHRGDIWVATLGMLHRFREASGDFERFNVPNAHITGLAEDRWGRLWAATAGGMLMFDINRDQVTTLYGLNGERCMENTFLPINPVSCLFHDAAGDLWAAFPGHGMVQIPEDVKNTAPAYLAIDRLTIRDAMQDRSGIFWCATPAGVLLVEPQTRQWRRALYDPQQRGSLSSNDTNFVRQDRQGTIWIGTVLGGVCKYVPDKPVFEHYTANPFLNQTLHGELVYAFAQGPADVIWVGSRNGISAFQVSQRRFLKFEGRPALDEIMNNRQVMALHVDARGDLWIGCNRLLVAVTPTAFDPAKGTISHRNLRLDNRDKVGYFHHISSFMEEADGTLWITTFGAGLWRTNIHHHSGDYARFSPRGRPGDISSHMTRAVLRDRQGTLWVGSWRHGLNRMEESTGTFTVLRHQADDPTSLSEDTITALAGSSAGDRVWVGTYAGGLNALDPQTQTFKRITARDGLPDNTIYGILVAGDDLWLSTNNGLACIANADDDHRRTIKTYSVHDGLQSGEYNRGAYFQARDGSLYMGGINGFNLFHPKGMNEQRDGGDVFLSDLFVNGRSRRFTTPLHQLHELTFDPQTRVIGFEFAAANFATPARNRYAYRLEGVDGDWQRSNERRSLQYSNLAPGRYRLRAFSLNREDQLSGRELRLDLTIRPAFHQTLAFRLLVFLAVILTGLSLVWLRLAALRREQEQRRDFARGLIAAQERDRARIADELHDSLGQNLLVINNELQWQAQTPQAAPLKDDLMQMSVWVRDAIEEVRRIAYNLRPHQLDRLGLKRAISSIAGRLARGGGFKMEVVLDDIEGLLDKDAETHLFRIVQEGLQNVVRHAEASRATLTVKQSAGRLVLHLNDNGKGFSVKTAQQSLKGMGLRTMMERADLMNAELVLESQPGRGTRLTLTTATAEVRHDSHQNSLG